MAMRVAITGMGAVTCLGPDVETNWTALRDGKSGVGPITLFDPSLFKTRIAGEVRGEFDPSGFTATKELRRMDRFQQFTLAAAGEAMRDSGLETPPENPYRCGVIIGSGMGGLNSIREVNVAYDSKGPRGAHPLTIPKAVINLAPGLLSIRFGFRGPNFGLANACTSGASALGEAYRIVREGRADVMIAGGAEAVINELSVASFNALRALSTRNDEPEKASRPFDAERDGFVIAEGAAILVLESFDRAVARGARIHGEIIGYGATDDSFHMVMPDPEGDGAFQAMKIALEEARLDPSQIDYVNAHGTSTELNDAMETKAIRRLFGASAEKVSISSTKSMTGHMIGAAGAVEAVYTLLSMKNGIAPPTINLENPDPKCDLDYTPNQARPVEMEHALSNSFAFGGQNACLVFRRVA